jgi:hypothetical protein
VSFTLITKIGPTAFTSYASIGDDFWTLLSVVSVSGDSRKNLVSHKLLILGNLCLQNCGCCAKMWLVADIHSTWLYHIRDRKDACGVYQKVNRTVGLRDCSCSCLKSKNRICILDCHQLALCTCK